MSDLTSGDFINYWRYGLERPREPSGVAVFTERRKIVSIYIIINLSKGGELAHVEPKTFHNFIDYHVESCIADQNRFVAKMYELRGDRLLGGRRGYNLAEAVVFNINPEARNAHSLLVAKIERIRELLPMPYQPSPKRKMLEEASVQPSPAEPPVTNKGPTRRSSGANDLVEGLLETPTDHEITRETTRMIKVAKEMMDHSDDGCIMRHLASALRDTVARTRARGFPTLPNADSKLSGHSVSSTSSSNSISPHLVV